MYDNSLSTGTMVALMLFSLAIAALLGYWAGRIALRKGYEFWIGFIAVAGFFGGLIGVLIIYVIPERRRMAPPPSYYQQQSPINYGLPPEQPPPCPPGQHGQPSRTKACQQCGYLAEGMAEFCQYCGGRLPIPPPVHGPTSGGLRA
jgi:hypothetical protein